MWAISGAKVNVFNLICLFRNNFFSKIKQKTIKKKKSPIFSLLFPKQLLASAFKIEGFRY